jgi:AcrR family transcriptional regulator
MLDSARDLFLEKGFAATTVAQIADGAEVAEQTIYYTFRSKGRLLIEVVETTAAGESDPEPVPQRAWFQQMLAATSGERVLALVVENGTAIYERVAALWPAVNAAAATDPEVAEYWHGIAAGRRNGERAMVSRIAELGELRPSLNVESVTDIVTVLAGHDVYRGLVQEARWPVSTYRTWLFNTLVRQLLDRATPDGHLSRSADSEPQ